MAIDIVKLANGNVAVYDATSGDFLRGMSPDIVEIECNELGVVKVIQDNGNVEYFDPAEVANTQVQPAAAIPFAGDCAALATLLSTDFFFVVSNVAAIDVNYDNSVSGLTATNVQDAIDEIAVTRHPSGFWQDFTEVLQNPTANLFNVGVQGYVVLIEKEVTTNKVRMRVNSPNAGQTAILGIYKYTGTNFTLYAQAVGTVDLGLATTQELSYASNVVLTPGIYCVAVQMSALSSIEAIGLGAFKNVFGFVNTMGGASYLNNIQFAAPYTGTMPATISNAFITAGSLTPHILHNII